jgi:hypothetical protein
MTRKAADRYLVGRVRSDVSGRRPPDVPAGRVGREAVKLVSTREYPSGVVELRYERAGAARRRP